MTRGALLPIAGVLVFAAFGDGQIAHAGSQHAGSQDAKWISLGETRGGVTSYDPASTVRTGQRIQVSVRGVSQGDTPGSFVVRVELDCKQPSIAVLSGQQFGTTNEVILSKTVPAEQIRRDPLFDGSADARLYRLFCPNGTPLPKFGGLPTVVVPSEETVLP